MPRVEFEPTVPVFEGAKTVHALDCAATVMGDSILLSVLHTPTLLLNCDLPKSDALSYVLWCVRLLIIRHCDLSDPAKSNTRSWCELITEQGNAKYLYSRGTWFECRPGHRLQWLKLFAVSFSSYRNPPRLSHTRCFLRPFILPYYSTLRGLDKYRVAKLQTNKQTKIY
jgi:hypothetical protein